MPNKLVRWFLGGLVVLALAIAAMPARGRDVVADPDTCDCFMACIGQSVTITGTATSEPGGTVFITDCE